MNATRQLKPASDSPTRASLQTKTVAPTTGSCPEQSRRACPELSRREGIGFVFPYFQNFGPFLALEVDITSETNTLLRHNTAPPLNAISRLTTVLTTPKKRLMSSGQPSSGPPQTLARMDVERMRPYPILNRRRRSELLSSPLIRNPGCLPCAGMTKGISALASAMGPLPCPLPDGSGA